MATAPTAPITDVWPQVSTGQVTFYWRAPASDGGSAITKYTLSCAAISYSQDVSATRLDFTVTGLTDKTDYVFEITATNAIGASPTATFPVVQPGATPFGPTVATASTLNTSTALVSWTPSTLATEGSLRAYVVQVIPSTPAISSYFITMFPFKSTMAIAGLSTNTYYQFLVRGINDVGYCPPFAYTSTLGFGIVQTAFSPSSLAGMQLWLDATKITGLSNTQALTSWIDSSPSPLSNTTSGSPSAPTYRTNQMNGLPIVRFNGGYINLGSNLQIGTDPGQSIFTVLKFNETGSDIAIIGRNNEAVGRWGVDRYQGTLRYYVQTPSGFAAAEFTNNNNASTQILNVSWNRAVASMYINAEVKNSNAFSSSDNIVNSSLLGIGAFIQRPSGGPIWYMNADVAEILYYNRGLTPFDRQKVEGYLAWKWGLSANLPTTHPFKLAAPTSASVFSPSSITGLGFWVDANDVLGNGTVLSNGTAVTSWVDKSGSGRTVAGSGPTFSTYQSRNSVLFNSNYLTASNNINLQNMTMFVVGLSQTSAANQTVFTIAQTGVPDYQTNAGFGLYYDADTPRLRFYGGSNGSNYGLMSASATNGNALDLNIASYTLTGSNGLSQFFNGSSAGSITNPLSNITRGSNANQINIGRSTDGQAISKANMSELLVYTRTLSTDDRQTVEGYLAWKWGLQGNLPSTHPYKSQNPASLVSPTPYFATNFNNGNDANLINYASSNLSTNTVTSTGYSYSCPSSNYLTSPIQMQNTNTISYCISIYRTGTLGGDGRMGLLFSRDGTPASGLNFINDTNLSYSWNNESGTWSYDTGISIPLNTWRHVTLTISPTEAKWYINGVLSTTKTYSHSSINISTVCIGADTFSSKYFRGLIDNVAVYNTTLTAAQISSIYAQTLVV